MFTSQLLEKLSSGHQLTIDELDELDDLINRRTREDQFLEYKSGLEIQDKDAGKTIRDYLCGFANSDGGVLIFGIEAPSGNPEKVDGCKGHKKGDLAEWAARCLTEVASYFSPLPKFQVLGHPNGEILIGITQRSLNLIPQIENKKTVYYLRFHDQTLKAPEYLMADLLLGRKQRPDFEITNCFVINFERILDNSQNSMDMKFELRLKCESRNIVWAEDSRWGLIAWTQFKELLSSGTVSHPSNQLMSFIDVQDLPVENKTRPGMLLHYSRSLNVSKPFDAGNIFASLSIPIRLGDRWFSFNWMAALYIVAKNSPPMWYQIELKIIKDAIKWVDDKAKISLTENKDILSVTKLTTERPIVAWMPSKTL